MGRIALLASLLLAGCATSGDFCAITTPLVQNVEPGAPTLRPSKGESEKLSDGLAKGLDALLSTGVENCGWKP